MRPFWHQLYATNTFIIFKRAVIGLEGFLLSFGAKRFKLKLSAKYGEDDIRTS